MAQFQSALSGFGQMALVDNSVDCVNADQTLNGSWSHMQPVDELLAVSTKIGHQLKDVEFARYMDSVDPLRHLRDEFCYPKMKTLGSGRTTVYHNRSVSFPSRIPKFWGTGKPIDFHVISGS